MTHGRDSSPATPRPIRSGPAVPRHRFDVVTGPAGSRVVMVGDLDMAAAPQLVSLLAPLLRHPAPLTLDAERVDFADCAGLAPIVAASRSTARGDRAAPVRVQHASRAFRRVFDVLGVRCEPVVDVAAWDTAALRLRGR